MSFLFCVFCRYFQAIVFLCTPILPPVITVQDFIAFPLFKTTSHYFYIYIYIFIHFCNRPASTPTRSATISRTTHLKSTHHHPQLFDLTSRPPNPGLTPAITSIFRKSFLPTARPSQSSHLPRIHPNFLTHPICSLSTRPPPFKILRLHRPSLLQPSRPHPSRYLISLTCHLFSLQDPIVPDHLLQDRSAHLWDLNIFEFLLNIFEFLSSPYFPPTTRPCPFHHPYSSSFRPSDVSSSLH